MPQPATSLAIVFADISGGTHLYETLGDEAAQHLVVKCLSVLRQVIRRHGGTVLETIGDEVMNSLPDANAAVQAAQVMQQTITEDSSPDHFPLAIREGVHFGSVLVKNKQV